MGIGEYVDCWVDSSTWSDTDIYADPYNNQSYVADQMGLVVWSVSGPGSVYPTVTEQSTMTTLTIDLADEDGVVTITAQVWGSRTKGLDPPVQKQKAMNEKVPTGINPIGYVDKPPLPRGTDLAVQRGFR